MSEKKKENRRASRASLERVREFITAHRTRHLSLDQLASLAGLSRFHLVRAFSQAFGRPPHAYQLHLQVERARCLLDKGALPAEAASEAGFADQSHFSRHFKKAYGVTPRQYVNGGKKRR